MIALAVAAVLVLSLTGMFMGLSKSFSATVDRSPGEVMILAPNNIAYIHTYRATLWNLHNNSFTDMDVAKFDSLVVVEESSQCIHL